MHYELGRKEEFVLRSDRLEKTTTIVEIVAVYPSNVTVELVFPCGHKNYGTPDKPASVQDECKECRQFYCDRCNYDRHTCYGCGEWLSHRTEKFHYQIEHYDD